MLSSVIVGARIGGMIEAQLRAQQYSASHPVSPTDQMLIVASLEARALASQVVEEFGAEGEIILGTQLVHDIIKDRPLRGEAGDVVGLTAHRPVGTGLQQASSRCVIDVGCVFGKDEDMQEGLARASGRVGGYASAAG